MSILKRLKKKAKERRRFGKPKSPTVAELVAGMDDDRLYWITDDDGRPMMGGLQMTGRNWKAFVGGYKQNQLHSHRRGGADGSSPGS